MANGPGESTPELVITSGCCLGTIEGEEVAVRLKLDPPVVWVLYGLCLDNRAELTKVETK